MRISPKLFFMKISLKVKKSGQVTLVIVLGKGKPRVSWVCERPLDVTSISRFYPDSDLHLFSYIWPKCTSPVSNTTESFWFFFNKSNNRFLFFHLKTSTGILARSGIIWMPAPIKVKSTYSELPRSNASSSHSHWSSPSLSFVTLS